MKLRIISDLTLDPLIRELKKNNGFIETDLVFTENIEEYFLFTKPSNDVDFIIVHIDNYFKKYPDEKLVTILKSLDQFSKNSKTHLVLSGLFNNPIITESISNSVDQSLDNYLKHRNVFNALIDNSNITFFEFSKCINWIGVSNSYNYNLGHLFQMPYTKALISNFSKELHDYLKRLYENDKKVIILDCDNTLWGGVVGEDGIDNLKCDLNSEGVVFWHFQLYLKRKKEEGFLLAIVSKNNINDVAEVFNKKPMPTKWSDFIIKKINWEDKVENIKSIAVELNLGLDSLIFIDDSDFELQSVRQILPEVTSIKFNANYDDLVEMFSNYSFRKKIITKEDLKKTEQYELENSRKQILQSSISIDEYIKSLDIKLQIDINNLGEIERLSQLTEKTNQFNFNKNFYTTTELITGINLNKFILFSLKVSDRFGDYGIVGLVIIEIIKDKVIMENFIMSCRALGRKIEDGFFESVKDLLQSEYNLKITTVEFKQTAKNLPAQEFYNKINI